MELRDVESDITEILFTEEQIQNRLAELAREIERDYQGKDVLIIAVLKGAVMVLSDLVRELKFHAHIDFMAVSSYGSSTKSSGVVRIVKDLDAEIAGRHVLIVEDIIDSGNTLSKVREILSLREPKSLAICTLLDKPSRREVNVPVEYVGFAIPDEFVVGYGIDYAQRYRHLPYIGKVTLLDE